MFHFAIMPNEENTNSQDGLATFVAFSTRRVSLKELPTIQQPTAHRIAVTMGCPNFMRAFVSSQVTN